MKNSDDVAPQYQSLRAVVRSIVDEPLDQVNGKIEDGLKNTRFQIDQAAGRTIESVHEALERPKRLLEETLTCLRDDQTGLSAIVSKVEDHHSHSDRQAVDLAQGLADTVGRQAAELRSGVDDHVRAVHEYLSAESSLLQSHINQLASQSAERMEQLTAEQTSARQAMDGYAKRQTVLLGAAIVGIWATFALLLWQFLAS